MFGINRSPNFSNASLCPLDLCTGYHDTVQNLACWLKRHACEIYPVALQASLKAARATEHTNEGWHVEACSTHIAITCSCVTGPFTKVLVYAVQVCPSCPSMKAGSIRLPSSFFAVLL